MTLRTRAATALLLTVLVAPVQADEGMWLPEQLANRADVLRELGLALEPSELGNLDQAPLGAVISLGGCSASFVSELGLVVTNHHCAVNPLQQNSTAERNLLEDGFYAETREDEIWAGAGSRVYVTQELTVVTERVLSSIPEGATDTERREAIELAEKELVAECESQESMRCDVATYYGGDEYRLIRQLEIEDVRLVYAPAGPIGNYGGEIDNWMWPRHTGDWTFFRAYVSPDGAPAPYSEDNVPFRPEHHLTVSRDGVADGDFVMVAGYPWRTQRNATAFEMAHAESTRYPWSIQTMGDMLAIVEAISAEDEDAAVRLAPFGFGLSNYLKNNQGMLDGFTASGVVARAEALDAELSAWLEAGGSDRHSVWAADVVELRSALEGSLATEQRERLLGWMSWGSDLFGAAARIHWLAVEREKPDLERDQGYQERDVPRIAERMARMDQAYVDAADRQLLAYFFERSQTLAEGQRLEAVDALLAEHGGDAQAAVAALYDHTTLADQDTRLALLEADRETIEASDDPMIQLLVALYPLRVSIHEAGQAEGGAMSRLRPSYIRALSTMRGGDLYPDANGTLRVTYGSVRGYSPADGVWHLPLTTLQGIAAKHTGEEPFNAPAALLEAIESGDYGPYADPESGSVPVNFLSTLDTTGGNSGSVTLNARGELCGLLFDGNYEAMASDWLFDPVATRSIQVDVRYVLWVMDRVDRAHRILREMGIEPVFDSEG